MNLSGKIVKGWFIPGIWQGCSIMIRCIVNFSMVLLVAGNALGVLLENTGDPEANTSAPPPPYGSEGWNTQGQFGAFSGTPIAPNLFITAKHIGGGIGDTFILDGVHYKTMAYYPDPDSDLILWKIDGTFPSTAQLASQNPSFRQEVLAFGRGTRRGTEIRIPKTDGDLRGWKWGPADGRLRWGTNRIASFLNENGQIIPPFVPDVHWIQCFFDQGESTHECHLSRGDSGGGIFIQEGDTWKLCAINYAVSGPYRYSVDSADFEASLLDASGLFTIQKNSWTQIPDLFFPQPSYFLATATPSKNSWIESIRQPLDSGREPIFISSATSIDDSFVPVDSEYEVIWTEQIIQIPVSGDQQFFHISSPADFKFKKVKLSNTHITVFFE